MMTVGLWIYIAYCMAVRPISGSVIYIKGEKGWPIYPHTPTFSLFAVYFSPFFKDNLREPF